MEQRRLALVYVEPISSRSGLWLALHNFPTISVQKLERPSADHGKAAIHSAGTVVEIFENLKAITINLDHEDRRSRSFE